MDFGYARTSTRTVKGRKAQHTDNQTNRLEAEGISPENILVDAGVSGRKASRPEWDRLLATLRQGDTLTVTSMSRIGRSLQNLLDIMAEFDRRGVNVKFLDQQIDTGTANGRLVFHVMAAISEWEAAASAARVVEGLEAARERHGGNLPTRGPSFKKEQRETAEQLLRGTDLSVPRIAAMVNVSTRTLYRHVPVEKIRAEKAEAAS